MSIFSKFNFFSQREAPTTEPKDKMEAYGVAGSKVVSGIVFDEFLLQLQGRKGRATYREMRDNDDMVGAIFFMIEGIIKAVDWRVEIVETDEVGSENLDYQEQQIQTDSTRTISTEDEAKIFLEGVLFEDMTHTWEDFLMNVITGLTFGWQWTEIIWKKRSGTNPNLIPQPNSPPQSRFNDGMIGIEKLADRSQETLDRWDEQDGVVYGIWQEPPNGGATLYIPAWKSIHFKTLPNKDNPEGRSMLRNAYRPWFFKKRIQEYEAMGIERELNGLPVVYIPSSVMGDSTKLRSYEDMVRNVKFNEQGGVVLPSDTFLDADGNPSSVKTVDFQLLSSGGSRAIDADKVITRYDTAIARSMLTQFLMLGLAGSKGGYAQSRNETDLFFRAAEGLVENIASTINRQLIPKIWQINGLDPAIMPYVSPGRLSPEDLQVLGDYVQKLSTAGISLIDPDTVKYLRSAGGLPENMEGEYEDNLTFDEGEENEEVVE